MRGLLADHCAEEIKTIGDALMLRCDLPADAMRLGLRIVRELEGIPGFPLARVGVHTGTAVCRDGDWYGTTVNVAARLCTAAGAGSVLVSEETCRAAGRLRKVELGDTELHWLKNLTEPVEARLVSASRAHCPVARLVAPRMPTTRVV